MAAATTDLAHFQEQHPVAVTRVDHEKRILAVRGRVTHLINNTRGKRLWVQFGGVGVNFHFPDELLTHCFTELMLRGTEFFVTGTELKLNHFEVTQWKASL
eukprot:TRINITY_DN4084_c0_g1_i1.p2 TRINITY_DN4084_c0_g1~~TRINITY_DN4084_c0_g1_i1.p2  ORF type:complete len:101 (+),score=17.44 TRINITY_DN4084_c0_g1_i1:412-714(+)